MKPRVDERDIVASRHLRVGQGCPLWVNPASLNLLIQQKSENRKQSRNRKQNQKWESGKQGHYEWSGVTRGNIVNGGIFIYKCPRNDKNCIMIISSWDSKDIFGGTSGWKGNLPIPIVPFPFSKPFNQLESSLPSVRFCLMRNCAPLLTHSHS